MIKPRKSKRERLLARLPPLVGAVLEYKAPEFKHPEMDLGPFNGQKYRQKLFRELMHQIQFNAIVETGTYRGATTKFLAAESDRPVYTIEYFPRFYYFSRIRLRKEKRVKSALGDTRQFLTRLASDTNFPKQKVFFYLDAHWVLDDLPLRTELEIIASGWESAVIMIDDFQVPGDEGYGYFEFLGDCLSMEYLAPLEPLGFVPFFPATPSSAEGGARRGFVVLGHGDHTAKKLEQIALLRRMVR
jgi:hypothetical protein